MLYELNYNANVNMTSYKGMVIATYPILESLFGEPQASDEYKVSGEWVFEDELGNVFTLYDWKSTSLYDSSLPSIEEFRLSNEPCAFNVGGRVSAADFIAFVNELIKGKI